MMGEAEIDISDYKFDGASEDSIDRSRLAAWLDQNLQTYITMQNLAQPFFGYRTLPDKWNELERCYRGHAKNKRDKKHEYAGYSNVVTGEFHKTINVMVDKWMRALFSGAQQFSVKPSRHSAFEDAHLAQLLAQYSMDRVDGYENEVRKVAFSTVLFGTGFAHIPWTVTEEYRGVETLYAEKSADGSPGRPSDEPEMFEIYDEIKLTDFRSIDPRKVYLNPDIADLQDQESIYIKQSVSWAELVEMEADGIIDQGMADFMLEHTEDDSNENKNNKNTNAATGGDNRLLAFDIYLVYKRMQFADGQKRLYEIIYAGGPKKILGLRPYLYEHIPMLKSNFIQIDSKAHGLALGEIIYSVFLAMCGRLNQVIDAESMQILGGGIYDSDLISENEINKAAPGIYIGVPGLLQYLSGNASPVLSFQKLSGAHPASVGLDVMAIFNRSIQDSSGITNTVAGMPTNTQADKTFRGMELLAEEADVRIGASLELFEADIPQKYAEAAYDNYTRFLDPQVDLPRMFDQAQLTYMTAQGQQMPVRFGENLRQVEFVFNSAKRMIERDARIGKIQRFVEIVGVIGQASQMFSSLGIDAYYFIQEIARQLDFVDLDVIMPPEQAPLARLQQMQAQAQQLQTINQAQTEFIEALRAKLSGMADQSGMIAMMQAQKEIEQKLNKQGVMQNG
jgi:hypothetical protein